VKFKLDENLPVSSSAILTSAGHDVDTVIQEGLIGAPDQDVVDAAAAGLWFGRGTLPRKELHEAAERVTANQAGPIAVGEPTAEKGLHKALPKAAKVVKRAVRGVPAGCVHLSLRSGWVAWEGQAR